MAVNKKDEDTSTLQIPDINEYPPLKMISLIIGDHKVNIAEVNKCIKMFNFKIIKEIHLADISIIKVLSSVVSYYLFADKPESELLRVKIAEISKYDYNTFIILLQIYILLKNSIASLSLENIERLIKGADDINPIQFSFDTETNGSITLASL